MYTWLIMLAKIGLQKYYGRISSRYEVHKQPVWRASLTKLVITRSPNIPNLSSPIEWLIISSDMSDRLPALLINLLTVTQTELYRDLSEGMRLQIDENDCACNQCRYEFTLHISLRTPNEKSIEAGINKMTL